MASALRCHLRDSFLSLELTDVGSWGADAGRTAAPLGAWGNERRLAQPSPDGDRGGDQLQGYCTTASTPLLLI